MSDTLIIKKYSNRRLYNTALSAYITLDDVRDLVRSNKKFRVVDARTMEDMTNYVLLQIITEEEAGKFPMFSTDLLLNIIRYYDSPMKKTMTEYLEKGLSMLNQQNPLDVWQQSMTNIMDQFTAPLKKSSKKKPK